MENHPNLNRSTKPRRLSRFFWLATVGLAATWALAAPAQAQDSISYNFRQSQTKLSVTVESSRNINSSHWSYAGPLDDRKSCSNQEFPNLDSNLKGQAPVTKLGAKKAKAEIDISPANNNKLYCLIIEGYPTPRRLDYNPPVIELDDKSNLIKARDSYHGSYGPNGTVDSSSWQVAVFKAAQAGSNYSCEAGNQDLDFRPISSKVKYVSQYSYGNTNHLAYNVHDHRQSAIEFFEKLKAIIYPSEETDPALIPFIDGQWNPEFTDNIHLCHRVSDPQGNTSYKLMRLDFGGPVIKLQIDGQSIRASSPAVDLDDSTWQYLATDQRHISGSCELIEDLSDPTGQTAVVNPATNNHYYCFLVFDKQGNVGRAWIRAELGQATSSPTTEPPATTTTPPPADNQQQNQQSSNPAPEPDQTSPEPINDQATGVDQADQAPEPEPDNAPDQPTAEPNPVVETDPETNPETSPAGQDQATTASGESTNTTEGEDEPTQFPTGPLLTALAVLLLIVGGAWMISKALTRSKPDQASPGSGPEDGPDNSGSSGSEG